MYLTSASIKRRARRKTDSVSAQFARGFTLVEFIVGIAIVSVLLAGSVPAIREFQKESQLDDTAQKIVSELRLAQSKTISSEGDSRHGVYFDTASSPDRFILFQGASYASRNQAMDEPRELPSIIEISQINLSGGSEVAFDRIYGTTSHAGTVMIRLARDTAKTRTITINSSGRAFLGTGQESLAQLPPLRDSRHAHFSYARAINTATESLTLTFPEDGPLVRSIPIAPSILNGQIYWKDTIIVGGVSQTILVQTHSLNNPNTLFSIVRDRRLNTKAVTMTISGDASGTLVQYAPDGQTTQGTSIYVSSPEWQ